MKFCPDCRSEYRDGFEQCSDCLVPLVDELPPDAGERKKASLDLVEVFSGPHPVAEQIRALLEGSGIPSRTKHEGSAAYPVNVGAMGDSRVIVRRQDAGEARELARLALAGDLELSEADLRLPPEGGPEAHG